MTNSFKGEIILYQTEDGVSRIQLREAEGTVWLTQAEMADLFDSSKQNISVHLKNIFDEGELEENAVVKEYLTTAADGKNYSVNYYNLDVILAVGYRVRSPRGTQFRRWASTTLREYLIKGFVLDDKRLKEPNGFDYFDELLERIRDIRASEKRFYQKVKDVFAQTSEDYDKNSPLALTFFKTIQNKLVYAVTGRTAAELIVERADPDKPNMALTTWAGERVRKGDVGISKNYLNADEMDLLNRLTTMFLDFAELRALDRQKITMAEWVTQTDRFLTFNERAVLDGAGNMSHQAMETIITKRYALFEENRRRHEAITAEQEHEQEMQELQASAQKLLKARKPADASPKKTNKGKKKS
jgi:hypothetical protein